MITDDEIMRLFELADPARDDDGAQMVDAAGYVDALLARSYDMKVIDAVEAQPKSPRQNRWTLPAIIAAAIVLSVAGGLILVGGNEKEQIPVAPPTTVTRVPPSMVVAVEPTTSDEQAGGQSIDEAIALVRSYYDATNGYDASLAMSYLADDVTFDGNEWRGAEDFRLGMEAVKATRGKFLLGDCTPIDGQSAGITIRCDFEFQDLRSAELGLGPFLYNSVDVRVVDGKIASITALIPFAANGYMEQVWNPFMAWIDAQHPDDAPVLQSEAPTQASIQLWEQRSREYVELRLTAERVAAEFLEAFAAFDAEAAGRYLADGASTEGIVVEDVQDHRQAIALYQAWGYEQELGSCRQRLATLAGLQVRCPFAYHLMSSRELGLGPFDGSYFTVTVDSGSGRISEVDTTWRGEDFSREVWDPFTDWLTSTHPDEAELMSVEGDPVLTPESLALWEQLRREYVQSVLGTTPSTTAP